MLPASDLPRRSCAFGMTWLLATLAVAGAMVLSGCTSSDSVALPDEEVALGLVEVLEWSDLPRNRMLVEERLKDSSERVRLRAARALGRMHGSSEDLFGALLSTLENESAASVRLEAWFALECLGFEPNGLVFAPEEDPVVREAQARCLGRGSSGEVADRLLPWLVDDGVLVRRAALLGRAMTQATPTVAPHAEGLSFSVYADEADERVRWAHFWSQAWCPQARWVESEELLRAGSEPNFFSAAFALSSLRDRAESTGVEAVLSAAAREGASWLQREAAWHTLAVLLERSRLDAATHQAIAARALARLREVGMDLAPLERRRVIYTLVRCDSIDAGEWRKNELPRLGSPYDVAAALRSVAEGRALRDADARTDAMLAMFSARSEAVIRLEWARAAMRFRGHGALLEAARSPLAVVRACAARDADELSAEIVTRLLSDPDPAVLRALLWGARASRGGLSSQQIANVLERREPGEWPLRMLALDVLASRDQDVSGDRLARLIAPALTDPVYEVARRARRLVANPAPFPPAERLALPDYPIPRGARRDAVRYLRAHVRLLSGERFLIELFPGRAPRHVAMFVELARSGYYEGRSAERLSAAFGCILDDGVPDSHTYAAEPIPPETHPAEVLRGAVFSVPASWELPSSLAGLRDRVSAGVRGPSRAGSLVISHLPLPALRGIATVWGRVVQGMAVVDRLDESDTIASVEVTGWNLAAFDER